MDGFYRLVPSIIGRDGPNQRQVLSVF